MPGVIEIALFATAFVQRKEQLFSEMLKPESGASTGELCRVDSPSTPQNEADTRYGCTADPRRPYPYPTNPATVSIEEDYLYAPEPDRGPIFSEFSADSYLRSVENPISSGCDADDFGHRRGMSQEGARLMEEVRPLLVQEGLYRFT